MSKKKANWSSLNDELDKQADKGNADVWVRAQIQENMKSLSGLLGKANVLLYFSAFMQKPDAPYYTQMMPEDINGVMNAIYDMDYSKELVVILHTPGGSMEAAECITKYIHEKFKHVTAIVPVMSASAGTMFALSCDKIMISKAGQLGPTDPQIIMSQGIFSVKDIKNQLLTAREAIRQYPEEVYLWGMMLQSLGPALPEFADRAEKYSKAKIKEWLSSKGKKKGAINAILKVFHDAPLSHGQRIDYHDMQDLDLNVVLLEDNQEVQEVVMVIYHLATLAAETSPLAKMIASDKWTWNKYHFRQA